MRQWLVLAMLVAAGATVLIGLALYAQVLRFKRRLPQLRDPGDLEKFKAMASVQMYASFVGIRMAWIPLIIWVIGKFFLRSLTWLDLALYVVLPYVIQTVIAVTTIGAFRAVRATPATDPALNKERERVAEVWLRRNFPDW
jgi:hypothetical protein